MILAIETATEVCSVAFRNRDGEIFEKRAVGRSIHATKLFQFLHELMQEHGFAAADLDAFIVSNGPGSYTGLRIGASAVKGFLFGTRTAVYGADTLAGMAQSQVCGTDEKRYRIHCIIDARRTHLYHREFTVMKNLVPITESKLIEVTDFEQKLRSGDVIVGTGLNRFALPEGSDIEICGTDCISAKHFITLFEEQPESLFFKETALEELNPDYITMNQVNNTAV